VLYRLCMMSTTSASEAAVEAVRFIPVEDLIFLSELRVCHTEGIASFQCPCRHCHGGTRYNSQIIRDHLREHKRDTFFMRSMVDSDPIGGWPRLGI
jgi:hypothetical protein